MGQIIPLHRGAKAPSPRPKADLPSADFEQRDSAREWRRRLMSQSSYRPTLSDRLSDAADDLRDALSDIFSDPLTTYALGICTGCVVTVGFAYLWSGM